VRDVRFIGAPFRSRNPEEFAMLSETLCMFVPWKGSSIRTWATSPIRPVRFSGKTIEALPDVSVIFRLILGIGSTSKTNRVDDAGLSHTNVTGTVFSGEN
jgi:hypothetical protein